VSSLHVGDYRGCCRAAPKPEAELRTHHSCHGDEVETRAAEGARVSSLRVGDYRGCCRAAPKPEAELRLEPGWEAGAERGPDADHEPCSDAGSLDCETRAVTGAEAGPR
jgi:hypothetical protein